MRCSLLVLLCTVVVAGACSAASEDFPVSADARPNAAAGECYCLFTLPAQFRTESFQEMVKPARTSWDIIPAEYETRSERVMVRSEGRRPIETAAQYRTESYPYKVRGERTIKEKIPAVYDVVAERVMVEKEKKRTVKLPAVFRTEEYRVCVSPARTEWRRSECNVTNVSYNSDTRVEGDACFCAVTVPATYETRTRQVCVEKERKIEEIIPARFEMREKRVCVHKESERKICMPAVYETRTRQVCVQPASVRYQVIPAEYRTIEKRVCVRPESRRRIEIPAEYQTRTREICIAPARQVWRRTECNMPQNVSVEKPIEKQ